MFYISTKKSQQNALIDDKLRTGSSNSNSNDHLSYLVL